MEAMLADQHQIERRIKLLRTRSRWFRVRTTQVSPSSGAAHLLIGPKSRGAILAALRQSPMVGADLDLTRSRTEARSINL